MFKRIEPKHLLILVLGALLFLFWGLGGYDLSAPDEPRFALVAREMIRDNPWLVPHRNQRSYPDKPPSFSGASPRPRCCWAAR